MNRKLGFTLAEVLITLGIIGVVAAMTIPTLLNQTGETEFRTGVKKMVSGLTQAVTMTVAVDTMDMSSLTGVGDKAFETILKKRMQVIDTESNGSNTVLYLNDGMSIEFPSGASMKGCTQGSECKIKVDVNGRKNPNVLSTATNAASKAGVKDQYMLIVKDQQVIPGDKYARYAMFDQEP